MVQHRMTLLLGPPGAGKTTLLLALAGKLNHDLNVIQIILLILIMLCAYIGPNNLHTGEMTMRETLDFSGRCLGVGPRHNLLLDILKMEKEGNGYMNATTLQDKETNLITDCVLKVCLIKPIFYFVSTLVTRLALELYYYLKHKSRNMPTVFES